MDVFLNLTRKRGKSSLFVDDVDLTQVVGAEGLSVTFDDQGPKVHLTMIPKRAEVSVEVESILQLIDDHLQTAYERGWRDACDDHLDQQQDPTYPIGGRYQQPYDPALVQVPRITDGGR